MAEMMLSRISGKPDPVDEDRLLWWPNLTIRETRIIYEALVGHDTVMEEDVSVLFRLRQWFGSARKEET